MWTVKETLLLITWEAETIESLCLRKSSSCKMSVVKMKPSDPECIYLTERGE